MKRWRTLPDGTITWQCATCLLYKPATDYYKKRTTGNGLTSYCKKCHSAHAKRTRDYELKLKRKREWAQRHYVKNSEAIKARQKEYYRLNSQRINAREKPTNEKLPPIPIDCVGAEVAKAAATLRRIITYAR